MTKQSLYRYGLAALAAWASSTLLHRVIGDDLSLAIPAVIVAMCFSSAVAIIIVPNKPRE